MVNLVEDFLQRRVSVPHAFHIVKEYCMSKGKGPEESSEFVTAMANMGMLNWCLSNIVDELCREHNIISLSTTTGKVIKIW